MWRHVLLCCFVFLMVGCKATNIKSFEADDEIEAKTKGENRLWFQADKFDTAMQKGRQIPDLPKIKVYLQEIMDRLYPEFKGHIKVGLHRAAVLNAFALPNGSIYINLGMLASLENEAQIASVLAHEGIHFLQKHSAKQRIYNQNSQGWAVAVSMIGIPLAGQLVAMNSMSGYSQEHETEADTLGFERLRKAGYATSEATRAFEILAREVKANDIDEPYFFASHPKLQERIGNFKTLNADLTDQAKGEIGFERYQSVVGGIREPVLKEKLAAGRVNAVLATLDDESSRKIYEDRLNYLKALALLKKADDESSDKAEKLLMAEVEKKPQFAEAHKELGFHFIKRKQNELAKNHLEQYLKFASATADTAFAEYYLKKMQ
ncbi:M48 family metallopeptidase [Neptuniibacter sp. QD34_54]|uniref:M48 family metallopeptidase n=1 Tax=Neptuniibacter sp. QD34_54 TaxID=3398208 RepID=UPI0039F5515F